MLVMCSGGMEPEGLSSNPDSATDVLCDLGQVTTHPTPPLDVYELSSSFIHLFTHCYWAPTPWQALMAPTLQELPDHWGRQVRGQKVAPGVMGAEGPEKSPE